MYHILSGVMFPNFLAVEVCFSKYFLLRGQFYFKIHYFKGKTDNQYNSAQNKL